MFSCTHQIRIQDRPRMAYRVMEEVFLSLISYSSKYYEVSKITAFMAG